MKPIDRLLEIDVTPWLWGSVLVFCAIGGFFGFWIALKALGIWFLALFLLSIPVLILSGDRTEEAKFAELSERFGGKVSRDWTRLGRRQLSFSYQGGQVIAWLQYPGRDSLNPPHFHLEIRGDLPAVVFEVRPRGMAAFARRMLGRTPLEAGSDRFRADFEVFGDPPYAVERAITEEVEHEVRSLLPLGLTHVTLHADRLEIVTEDEELVRVVEASVRIFDGVLGR